MLSLFIDLKKDSLAGTDELVTIQVYFKVDQGDAATPAVYVLVMHRFDISDRFSDGF